MARRLSFGPSVAEVADLGIGCLGLVQVFLGDAGWNAISFVR